MKGLMSRVIAVYEFCKGKVACGTFAALAFLASLQVASAADPVTLPDTGVDVAGYVTALITALGVVVAAVLGGYAAFLLIKKAMRWLSRALG